jgi:transcriptional regulator with XRE-family HTH domain
VSEHPVQSLEQGRAANPTLQTLLGLADALGVKVANLIEGVGLQSLPEGGSQRYQIASTRILRSRPDSARSGRPAPGSAGRDLAGPWA